MSLLLSTSRFRSACVLAAMLAGCAETPAAEGSGGQTGTGSGGQTGGSGGQIGSDAGAGSGGRSGSGGAATDGGTIGPSGMPAPPTSNVPKPSGTAANLKILNWAGFKGAVTYTFDDGSASQIAHWSELKALGVRFTFYLVTGWGSASNSIWKEAIAAGHEIGNHTQNHAQTGTGADIDTATTYIQQNHGVTPYTMAAPYGDPSYVELAKTRFLINRGVSNGLIGPNDSTDPFSVPCYIPATNAPASAFNSEVDGARSQGKWKIVLVHGFSGGGDNAFQPVGINELVSGVSHAKSLGDMWIDSMVNVGAYWRGQKTLSSVSPATSGSSKTWTWTLPAHFPPGKYLRVTVDGGTLSQKGTPLQWDSHGYYEVSLDAGSLTLSP